MIRRLRAVLLAGLGAGLLLGIPATAAAHTELRSSSPASGATLDATPATVVLTFNQAVQTEFAQVAVLDNAQAHLETGAASVVGENVTQAVMPLSAGPYTVSWRVVAADGHPVTGTFAFTVAAPPVVSPTSTPIAETPNSATTPSAEPSVDPTATSVADSDDSGLPAWAMTGIALGAAGAVGAIAFRLTRGPRNPSE